MLRRVNFTQRALIAVVASLLALDFLAAPGATQGRWANADVSRSDMGSPALTAVTASRIRTKRTKMVFRVPAPRKKALRRKTIRVHGKLSGRRLRRKRIRLFEMYMRLRRTDGTYGPKAGLGRKNVLVDPSGKRLVEVILGAKYYPARGRLRYELEIKNVGVPRRVYRRVRVTAQVTARYRF